MIVISLAALTLDRIMFLVLVLLQDTDIHLSTIRLVSDLTILVLTLWQTLYLRALLMRLLRGKSERLITLSLLYYFILLLLINGR
ncbi:MAG: hypothetical protein TR69_WS6001001300 [candidate division WS6 bacterium OLB20]|uniref:Uncharacterized protein n=1 Tax=candidate division WS6 bacterium OLB20 TaxID=1617426 RepID=A0A136LWI8_9BACT|nr:MAG: hypothetical protein TR69_WS6001001300 [candidate division WS6 bacterium OLB20]